MKPIIFIGSGKDFHAIDWYRNIKKVCATRDIMYATDIICSEGEEKLLTDEDKVINLYNIDWLLPGKRSRAGDIWRNVVKLLFSPLQVRRLKAIARKYPDAVFHAQTMYYLFISWKAGIRYMGSPQGSEILVRPHRSKLYRSFAIKALQKADKVLIDSVSLQKGVEELSGRSADIVQYGIDVTGITEIASAASARTRVVSIRGFYPIYRIEEIIKARDNSSSKPPITFFYPFFEQGYKEMIESKLSTEDENLGRLPLKTDIFRVLAGAVLAISIPKTDSSPRSVYESIFCGCCVAVTYSLWVESLPVCMKKRIVIVDIQDPLWLEKALEQAYKVSSERYIPSTEAINMFDEIESIKVVAKNFYKCS